MSAETDIYDFEGAIETAIETVLNSLDVQTRSAQTGPELQSPRPRCEVILKAGAAGNALFPEAGQECAPGSLRETTFAGKIEIQIITDPDMAKHAAYRARVRNAMSTIKRAVNGILLINHKINSCKTAGVTSIYKAENGDYTTTISYDIFFSIQQDKFANL